MLEILAKDKHPSLLRAFVHYGRFITLTLEANVKKLVTAVIYEFS
jgi:hypothetical protein